MIPDTDKLARYDDLANLVEELRDENMEVRPRYKDLDALICELRRQAASRNHTWPCVLLSDLIPLCDAYARVRQQLAERDNQVKEACAALCYEHNWLVRGSEMAELILATKVPE